MLKFFTSFNSTQSFASIALVPLMLMLSACGGGGGGDATNDAVVINTNTAPSVTIIAPETGQTEIANSDVTLMGSANDPQDGDISQNIEWSSNRDGFLGSGANLTVDLSAGNHIITASVKDSGSLSSNSQISLSVTAPVEQNTAPTLTIDSPNTNSVYGEGSSVTFTATASDQQDGNMSSVIQWNSSRDGALGNGASVSANLSIGTHIITAMATDSGDLSASAEISVTVNAAEPSNSAPSITIYSPTTVNKVQQGDSITFSGAASDAEDGDLSSFIQWSSNIDGNLATGNSFTRVLSVGSHTITASVADSQNVVSDTSLQITVEAAATNTPPNISISSPADNLVIAGNSSVSLAATANDEQDGNLNTSIQWASDIDGSLGTSANIVVNLSVGIHTVSATVTDSAGAESTDSIHIRVNAAPVVDAGTNQTVYENNLVELNAVANDNDGSIISYQWRQISGDTVSLSNTAQALASFTAPTLSADQNSQTFEFEVTVTDNDGAQISDSLTVTVIASNVAGDCTLTVSPGDSFTTAFDQLSAGDTLCLNDGVYQQIMDVPSYINVRAVNNGMAELDGMDTLGIEWQGGILTMRGTNSSVDGLRVHHAGTNADACTITGTNNTMRNTSCSHGGSHKHKIPLKISGSGHLVEDSWFFGEGRYVVQCYNGSNNIIRRNVMRWDETIANEPDEPNAAMSNYSCSDMIWENNISLDYGVPETVMVHCGDMCMSTIDNNNENYRVQYLGNMVVNHSPGTSNNRAFRADQKGTVSSSDITIRDFYVRGADSAIVFNPLYINTTLGTCTTIDTGSDGTLGYNQPVTCNDDADISTRYVDGVKTSEPLFPFANEALIKRDMCASGERQSDWCSSGKSLGDYVLNQ